MKMKKAVFITIFFVIIANLGQLFYLNRQFETKILKLESVVSELKESNNKNYEHIVKNSEDISSFQKNTDMWFYKTNKKISKLNNTRKVVIQKSAEVVKDEDSIAEKDYLVQKLFRKGTGLFDKKQYSDAYSVFKELMDMNSMDDNVACYYYSSLFLRNPGDSSLYNQIKSNIYELKGSSQLNADTKEVIASVLSAISLEEENKL